MHRNRGRWTLDRRTACLLSAFREQAALAGVHTDTQYLHTTAHTFTQVPPLFSHRHGLKRPGVHRRGTSGF